MVVAPIQVASLIHFSKEMYKSIHYIGILDYSWNPEEKVHFLWCKRFVAKCDFGEENYMIK